jgi:hypothetical protein
VGPLSLGAIAAAAGYPTMWVIAAISMVTAAGLMLVGSSMLRRHAVSG